MNKVQLSGEFKNLDAHRSEKNGKWYYGFTITNYDDSKYYHTIPCVMISDDEENFDGITSIAIEGTVTRRKRVFRDTGKELYETKILVKKITDKNFEVKKHD